MTEFLTGLLSCMKCKESSFIPISYKQFKEEYRNIENNLGKSGFMMISENIAILCFDRYPQIKIKIEGKAFFYKEDFEFISKEIVVIGNNKRERHSNVILFIEDSLRLWLPISIALIIFLVLFQSQSANLDKVKALDEVLINVTSIFAGTVFVFIGLFYSDKERSITLYKKGRCDKEYFTDKYIIKLSFLALICLIISYAICEIGEIYFKHKELNRYLMYFKVLNEFNVARTLTFIAIILLIICFDSLIQYYLRSCRNEFFVDAIDSMVKDRKENKN